MYVYSAKNNAFYPLDMRSDYEDQGTWPDDGIDVDEAIFKAFINPPQGKTRAPNENGLPEWVDIPPPSKEQLIAMAEQQKMRLRNLADSEISWLQDASDAGIATEEEITSLIEWKKYRVLLMRVDATTAEISWPVLPSA